MSAAAIRQRILPSALPYMTADGQVDIRDVVAVVFRNAGDATVNLWNGLYTLDCKETLSLNVTEDNYSFMDLLNIPVSFDTTTGSTKKLQIVVMKPQIAC